MMKRLSLLLLILLFSAGCVPEEKPWAKSIRENQVTIQKDGEYLRITVFVPQKNLAEFEESDSYTDLLTEAFADYLKISDNGRFVCPGLETVSEKAEGNGRTTLFRIPAKALKETKK